MTIQRRHSGHLSDDLEVITDTNFVPVRGSIIVQPLFTFKDNDVLGYGGTPENEYIEHGKSVSDFTLKKKAHMYVDHVAELCICLHSTMVHSAVVTHDLCGGKDSNGEPCNCSQLDTSSHEKCAGFKPDGAQCRCNKTNPVAPLASRHAYKRGQKAEKRRIADLKIGDQVTAGWVPTNQGRLRLIEQKAGALVVTVTGKSPKQAQDSERHWSRRMWIVATDLGKSVPQAGGDAVFVLKG